jgi:hypothetical protein
MFPEKVKRRVRIFTEIQILKHHINNDNSGLSRDVILNIDSGIERG